MFSLRSYCEGECVKLFVFLGVLVGLSYALVFVGGAFYSCGDGSIAGLRCVEPVVVSVCEDLRGERYVVGGALPVLNWSLVN